jgi:hypothetical protein
MLVVEGKEAWSAEVFAMQYLKVGWNIGMKRRSTDLGYVIRLPYRPHRQSVTLPTLGGALFGYLSPQPPNMKGGNERTAQRPQNMFEVLVLVMMS